jgi:hypothetical protein
VAIRPETSDNNYMAHNVLSTKRLTWNPKDRTFSAEISDFGHEFRFGQIYDDAYDEGLILVSDRTGNEAKYAIDGHIKDAEGDLVCWVLIPIRESAVKHPGVLGTKVILFND